MFFSLASFAPENLVSRDEFCSPFVAVWLEVKLYNPESHVRSFLGYSFR